jgi:hypothetical protein
MAPGPPALLGPPPLALMGLASAALQAPLVLRLAVVVAVLPAQLLLRLVGLVVALPPLLLRRLVGMAVALPPLPLPLLRLVGMVEALPLLLQQRLRLVAMVGVLLPQLLPAAPPSAGGLAPCTPTPVPCTVPAPCLCGVAALPLLVLPAVAGASECVMLWRPHSARSTPAPLCRYSKQVQVLAMVGMVVAVHPPDVQLATWIQRQLRKVQSSAVHGCVAGGHRGAKRYA